MFDGVFSSRGELEGQSQQSVLNEEVEQTVFSNLVFASASIGLIAFILYQLIDMLLHCWE